MKPSSKQSGRFYLIINRLEEENKRMRELLKEATEYLDTNSMTSIVSGSILHQRFKDAVSGNRSRKNLCQG